LDYRVFVIISSSNILTNTSLTLKRKLQFIKKQGQINHFGQPDLSFLEIIIIGIISESIGL